MANDGITVCKGKDHNPVCDKSCQLRDIIKPATVKVYSPLPDLSSGTLAEYGIVRFQVGRKGNVVTGYAVGADDKYWHRLTMEQRLEILDIAKSGHRRFYETCTRESKSNSSNEGWVMIAIRGSEGDA